MAKFWGVSGDYHRCVDHLPDGAPYGFVEVDLESIVSDAVYSKFEKLITSRNKHRKRKQEREESYAGKVQGIIDEKFEKIKRDAIHAVNTESVFLKPKAISHAVQRRES